MGNSKKLTPEEIAGRVCNGRMNVANLLHLAEYRGMTLNGTQLMLTTDAMKQYAAQEISEMKAQRDAALDERDNARIMVKSLQKERNEKGALLKEAYILIANALYLSNEFEERKNKWIKKQTGTEAGTDE